MSEEKYVSDYLTWERMRGKIITPAIIVAAKAAYKMEYPNETKQS